MGKKQPDNPLKKYDFSPIKMRKPSILKSGDLVALTSHSNGTAYIYPNRYQIGKRQLEEAFHLRTIETPNALLPPEELYNSPQKRADDIHWALKNPNVKAIFSIIGGDDAVRLIPYLDFDLIRKHPKIFLGYSDATVLHFAFMKAGIVSIYGPSILSGFAENGGLFPYMRKAVQNILFSDKPIGNLVPNLDGWTDELLNWGNPSTQQLRRTLKPSSGYRFLNSQKIACGRLIGGCIEVLDMLKGSAVWPSPTQWDGCIFFFEISEETPPPRWLLYQLRNYAAMGILKRMNGILFGRVGFVSEEKNHEYEKMILKVLQEENLDIPVVSNMDFGHTEPQGCIPYGVSCQINPLEQTVTITENALERNFKRNF